MITRDGRSQDANILHTKRCHSRISGNGHSRPFQNPRPQCLVCADQRNALVSYTHAERSRKKKDEEHTSRVQRCEAKAPMQFQKMSWRKSALLHRL